MARKRGQRGNEYRNEVEYAIKTNRYENGTNFYNGLLPPPREVREQLEKYFSVCSKTRNKEFSLILVEDLDEYKVFIQTPGDKSECDFFVWRAVFKNGKLVDLKIPTHDDLGKMFLKLKKTSSNVDEYLINATIRLLRDRMKIDEIIDKYFKDENEDIKKEIRKFLATLKWIGLQEDVNYPQPKYLGSLYALAVYALLEIGIPYAKLRSVIKF